MSSSGILVDYQNEIAIVKLNNPSRANALSRFLVEDLAYHVDILAKNQTLRAVVFSAGESKAFCAGADLKERQTMNEIEIVSYVELLRETFHQIAGLPMPTIAAIKGLALGGGCELALACDLRVMEEDALIGLTEVSWGIIPGAGGTQRLSQLVGVAKAKELIFTARKLRADEAEKIGLIEQVCHVGESEKKALELAGEIAKNAPVAVRLSKAAIHSYEADHLENGLKAEWSYYQQTIPTRDRLEGLAAFREKRLPIYTGE
ncbi:enoyl-CoA hydratase-related protein [Effusibacillus consociatus]|uniref:Enoyl-CoA hydratase-related protein n=1 Tax=Effusibacillus consociatus TaxID=1117041 RepID=A0ABV9Q6G8_9BACL